MKTILTLLAALLLVQINSSAQVYVGEDLTLVRRAGENMFYVSGRKIKLKEVREIMSDNAAALAEIKRAQTNHGFAMTACVIGGLCIGWELGSLISGNGINGVVLGAGAGMGLISIPLIVGYNKRSAKAYDLYNTAAADIVAYRRPGQFGLGATGNGVGLLYRF